MFVTPTEGDNFWERESRLYSQLIFLDYTSDISWVSQQAIDKTKVRIEGKLKRKRKANLIVDFERELK